MNGSVPDRAQCGRREEPQGPAEGEEEEGVGGPSLGLDGPAGINWGLGQGRLARGRDNSLLEEIAQVPGPLFPSLLGCAPSSE